FRGWSGSARRHFTVRVGEATPGYLPGPLPDARWEILLGLYEVPEAVAIDLTVEVFDEPGASQLAEGPQTMAAARRRPPWRLGVPDGIGAVEAWGAPWLWGNGESLQFWDALWRRGRRLTGVGGSDIHDLSARRGHRVGTPTTWVPEGVDPLAAIRAGRVV